MQWEDTLRMVGASLLYGKMLANEVGEEGAYEVMQEWAEQFASQGIADTKKELGITGTTAKDLYNCLKAYHEKMIIHYEIEEETSDQITYRIKKCVMPTCCGMGGWDCKEICERFIFPLGAKVAAIISENLTMEVLEFNPNIEEGCRYRISKK
jgi:hypothetical protein